MKPYHRNPRQISQKRLTRLTDTLRRLGDLGGIVHNLKTDEIIGGHQRMKVFGEGKLEVIEQYEQPDGQGTIAHGFIAWHGGKYAYRQVLWDEATAAEANIAANLGAGEWDWTVIANAWDAPQLQAWGMDADALKAWNTDANNLREMLEAEKPAPVDAESQTDRAEELREKWGVKEGDQYQVGRSLALCGDALTVSESRADMVVTDPPYDMAPGQVGAIVERYSDRALLLVTGKQAFTFLKECSEWEFQLDFIWHHKQPRWTGSNHMPVYFHNNVLVVCKPEIKAGFYSLGKYGSSIIETEREYIDGPMGHSKSVELFEKLMRGFDFKNVADPFMGTGATLIACEQTGRRCLGVEKSATIFAVALERFADCGLTPERVNDAE